MAGLAFDQLVLLTTSMAITTAVGLGSPSLADVTAAPAPQTVEAEQTLPTPTLPSVPVEPDVSVPALADPAAPTVDLSHAEVDCVAKVVFHESANQPLNGQLAVAQLIVNRTRSSLFPRDVCSVVNQRGQFFNTAAYRVPRDPRWKTALTVARQALGEAAPQVVPGALFFHATYVSTPSFMRNRQRLAQIGGHVFYR